uniref:Uncharacterized protein n=1 Tax=Tanacetum cinerariifolium TaxID=118510 RepID=A0A6L2KF84_TANCI|nr:hypothetical protein [Tanacetum cinerariifolium]
MQALLKSFQCTWIVRLGLHHDVARLKEITTGLHHQLNHQWHHHLALSRMLLTEANIVITMTINRRCSNAGSRLSYLAVVKPNILYSSRKVNMVYSRHGT